MIFLHKWHAPWARKDSQVLFDVLSILMWRTEIEMGPDDGGSKHLWNVGQFLPDYTAQHPRRYWNLTNYDLFTERIPNTEWDGRRDSSILL
jgi:hypothetical protein